MTTIDLNAMKAERMKKFEGQEQPSFEFGGEKFVIPFECPFVFADAIGQANWREAFNSLLGDDAPRFFALEPSVGDLTALAEYLGTVYGPKE